MPPCKRHITIIAFPNLEQLKDGKLKPLQSLIIPNLDPDVIEFAKSLSCTWLGAVHVTPKPHCKFWDCHNNTINYTEWYGGERVLGYYLLKCMDSHRLLAILHSIVRKENGDLMDITPFDDDRKHNMFALLQDQIPNYARSEVWSENSFSGLSL